MYSHPDRKPPAVGNSLAAHRLLFLCLAVSVGTKWWMVYEDHFVKSSLRVVRKAIRNPSQRTHVNYGTLIISIGSI